jgi:hypothetical protein
LLIRCHVSLEYLQLTSRYQQKPVTFSSSTLAWRLRTLSIDKTQEAPDQQGVLAVHCTTFSSSSLLWVRATMLRTSSSPFSSHDMPLFRNHYRLARRRRYIFRREVELGLAVFLLSSPFPLLSGQFGSCWLVHSVVLYGFYGVRQCAAFPSLSATKEKGKAC